MGETEGRKESRTLLVLVDRIRIQPEEGIRGDVDIEQADVGQRLAQHGVARQHRVQPHALVDARVNKLRTRARARTAQSAVVPACIAQARILHLHLLQLRVVGQVGAPLQLVARRGQQLRLLVQVH